MIIFLIQKQFLCKKLQYNNIKDEFFCKICCYDTLIDNLFSNNEKIADNLHCSSARMPATEMDRTPAWAVCTKKYKPRPSCGVVL